MVWLPWVVDTSETKIVIGLGENMPVNLLVRLPFLIAMQCNINIGNLTCFSAVFNMTWKLTLKVPHKKDVHTLDAIMSSGK